MKSFFKNAIKMLNPFGKILLAFFFSPIESVKYPVWNFIKI